jgi:acyl carrier protein
MDNDQILTLIRQALGEVAPARKAEFAAITEDTRMDALGLDSIASLDLVRFIEEHIEVTFPDDELARVQKVGDLVGLVRRGEQ